jgi:hypothetical protein
MICSRYRAICNVHRFPDSKVSDSAVSFIMILLFTLGVLVVLRSLLVLHSICVFTAALPRPVHFHAALMANLPKYARS